MNILQILPELVVGGVETTVVDLSEILARQGHKIIVVSNGGPMVKQLENCGARHYALPVHKKSLWTILKCVKQLKKILKAEDIHIVHARSRVPAIIAFITARSLVSRNAGTHLPVYITTCHGYYSTHIFSKPISWGRFVICISNIVARHMIEDFGVPLSRVRFVSPGVNIDKFSFLPPSRRTNKNKTIGIIGRITPIKGHQFFIKAASRVIKSMPDTKIVIVGQPPLGKEAYLKRLKSMVNNMGISESVEFLGDREDVPSLLSKMDLLALSSVGREAFGRVIIEAQAAGVPVVATKVGGVTDIITDRQNGLLVLPYNANQMADAMLEIFNDKALSERLAQQARMDVENKFTVKAMSDKTLSIYQEALDHIRILVIKIGAVGDVILATPSLRAIRQKFPKAYMAVLVGLEERQILQNCPYIDELIIYNKPFIKKSISNFKKLADDLRKRDFDIVIDFQNSRRSHILSFLSMAPKRFGYGKKFGFLLNYRVKDSKAPMPPVRHQFRVLGTLGIELKDEALEVWPAKSDEEAVGAFLNQQWLVENQPLIGINIGGSRRWQTKRWPYDKLSQLCDELAARNMRVVLTGARHDQELAGVVEASGKSKPINAAGKTSLNELSALIKRCKVFISTDSAPMHIAAAVKTPVVAVFGPTDPDRHKPPSENVIIIKKELKCSPCYKPDCKKLKCIKQIDINEIVEAVDKFCRSTI